MRGRLRPFVLLMKPYAESFYKSTAWKKTSKAYAKSVGGLCERCRSQGIIKAGELVHHKEPVSPDNIGDVNITLNWNNLQLVCRECHADIHHMERDRRYRIDASGHVTARV